MALPPSVSKLVLYFVTRLRVLDTAATAMVCTRISLELSAFIQFIALKVSIFAVGTHGSTVEEWYWTSEVTYIPGTVSSRVSLTTVRHTGSGCLLVDILRRQAGKRGAAFSQGSEAIADVIIFVTTCYSLRRTQYLGIVVPENIADDAARLFVGRGLEFAIPLHSFPTKPYWISFQMIGVKFCVNAVLGLLNARQIRDGKGLYEEEPSIERKPIAAAGLPSGILFNAVGTRAVSTRLTQSTQSQVCFTYPVLLLRGCES
ncbi:hypothetical protein BU15DRAFT_68541 [Melanogaster broomeanus]|nr:hypothetical protein BU15DRAFT_68541 [Melanogaster broomeanus]